MKLAGGRVVLALDGLLFAGFGALYCIVPRAMAATVGIALNTDAAVIDLQGLYGGLELGVGCFLGWSALDPRRARTGLVVGSCALTGIALSRLLALARFGVPDATVASLIALDLVGAVLNVWFARRARDHELA